MEQNQFQRDIAIDPNRLDLECVQQAEKFFSYAQQAVEAKAEIDAAKIHFEVVAAKLDLECRQNPENFGLVKISEASVSAAVKCNDSYIKAQQRLSEAQKTARLMDAATNAMEQKKRMIESLITLHGQQYFAGPSVPYNLGEDWKEHQERISKNVTDKQKDKIRRRNKEE